MLFAGLHFAFPVYALAYPPSLADYTSQTSGPATLLGLLTDLSFLLHAPRKLGISGGALVMASAGSPITPHGG